MQPKPSLNDLPPLLTVLQLHLPTYFANYPHRRSKGDGIYRPLINLKDSNDSREKGTHTQASKQDFSCNTHPELHVHHQKKNKNKAQLRWRGGWGGKHQAINFLTPLSYNPKCQGCLSVITSSAVTALRCEKCEKKKNSTSLHR